MLFLSSTIIQVGKYYSDLLSQYSEKTKAYKSKVSESEDKLLIVVQLKDAQEKLKEMKDKRMLINTDRNIP